VINDGERRSGDEWGEGGVDKGEVDEWVREGLIRENS